MIDKMTYYLCLAVPQAAVPQLRRAFDHTIMFTDVTSTPIAEVTWGKPLKKDIKWSAFFVQTKHGSAILIAKASAKKNHNTDHSELLVKGLQSLIASQVCTSVSIMYHWMHGSISEEKITVKHEVKIKVSELAELIPTLEEDVRYFVSE